MIAEKHPFVIKSTKEPGKRVTGGRQSDNKKWNENRKTRNEKLKVERDYIRYINDGLFQDFT